MFKTWAIFKSISKNILANTLLESSRFSVAVCLKWRSEYFNVWGYLAKFKVPLPKGSKSELRM